VRFLIWLLLGYLVYRMVRGKKQAEIPPGDRPTDTHQDPVCGVYLSEADAVVGTLNGKKFYFCSRACLEQFQKQQQG
jgi:YHS domain-containing protein